MQLFHRPDLLKKIQPYYEDGIVKVLTGLRRCGKSSLLRLIAYDLPSRLDHPEEDFLFLNFEDFSLRNLTQPEVLHAYILEKAKNARKRLTVFLDEIQNVDSWEQVVNSLRSREICNLYVTGSNSKLLSGELATHLAGRALQFEVTPYSFKEFRHVRKTLLPTATEEEIWHDYLLWGGMPAVANYVNISDANLYLVDLFRSVVLRDITNRHNIRSTRTLETTLAYLMEQIGHRISLDNIEKFLKSERISVSRETLTDYVRMASEACLLTEVEGTDTIGKARFRFRPKMYLTDHGFRQAISSGINERGIDQVLENIVFMELRRRGWSVHYGTRNEKEVDFVAEKQGQRRYVQVSYLLASEETIRREFAPFYEMRDNWPKLVLSLDPVRRSQNGFAHENLRDWLLKDD